MNIFGKYPVTEGNERIGELEITPKGSMCRFYAKCSRGLTGVFRLAVVCGGRAIPIGVMTPSESCWKIEKTLSPASLRRMGVTEIEGARLVGVGAEYVETSRAAAGAAEAEASEAPPAKAPPLYPETGREPAEAPFVRELYMRAAEDGAHEAEEPRPESAPGMTEAVQTQPEIIMDEADAEADVFEAGWKRENEPERLFKDLELQRACRDMMDVLTKIDDGYTYLAVPLVRGRPFPAMPIFCFGNSRKINGKNYVVFKIKDGELHI